MRVIHIITRMIIGGAQENTLFNCLDLKNDFGDDVLLVTGPALEPEGRLLEQGRAGGLRVEQVHTLRRAIHPLYDSLALADLQRIIRREVPDVVHTHSAKGGFLGRAAAWTCKTPVVVHTVHGAPFHKYQSYVARRLFIACERWGPQPCPHLISVADAMTELMVAAKVAPREKFTTIYSGMDVEPFQTARQFRSAARNELGFVPGDVVFGKIARLFKLKGHEYVVAAAERIVRENRNCKFLLVGDGILRGSLERDIAARRLERHFVFTGLVPPERIPYYLSAMDALVHTSLREGLARTLPQALIAGLPVVSYDIDGAREVVFPGETGFLIEPQAIEPLAAAMLELARDSALRSRLGQGGAQRFTDRFRHQTMTEQIRALYQRLLEPL